MADSEVGVLINVQPVEGDAVEPPQPQPQQQQTEIGAPEPAPAAPSAVASPAARKEDLAKTDDESLDFKSSRRQTDDVTATYDKVSSTRTGKASSPLNFEDVDIDREFSTRLLSSSGFTSNVRENILSHPYVVKNRTDPSVSSAHISSESRQVMRKGFDMGIASPGLRMLYDARIKELEEELDLERNAKSKIERQRAELQKDITILAERLEEANDSAQQQVELNRRRETDFIKLQRDLEECQAQGDAQIGAFRKKHQEGINQLTDQLDQLQKAKQKIEKERNQFKAESDEMRGQIEHFTKNKLASEKLYKQQEAQISELNNKLNDFQREVADGQNARGRLQGENGELLRRLEESEAQVLQLNKTKMTLSKQLEEMKVALDDETCVRTKVLADNRSLQTVLDQLRDQLDEEQENRAEIQRQLTKALGESAMWKQKFESGEGSIRPEEVEELKRKQAARIQDSEAHLEAVVGKVIGLEKAKSRLQTEVDTLLADIERLQAVNVQNEKRQRQFDKLLDEWKRKVSDLQAELENSQKESRANAADAYKTKAQLEETQEVIDGLRRENKNLSEEIHDVTDQLGTANHKILEVEKVSKRFEAERDELHATLEEAEGALEQEEAKVQRCLVEQAGIKEELERRLFEREEEFENIRKNHQRAIDSMQLSLETETRNKIEALKIKKKLEQDISELEITLELSNKSKIEVEKSFKKYQQQIKDFQQLLDEEQRLRYAAREEHAASERKAQLLAGELEEMKAQLDVFERNRKIVEGELIEATDRISELTLANTGLTAAKKKLEVDIQALNCDYEDQINALKVAEEQARKAMVDAARIAEELRQEQDHASQIEKLRRGLETQLKDLQQRLDEAEAAALQGGKKMIQKLEQRVREVEVELEGEQHRHTDTQKTVRKQERRMQELTLQVDEDRKAQERMHDIIEKLQQKINSYKRQVEEAEEIAAINLAKYRKLQHDLEESEARADVAESMAGQLRAKNRTSMSFNESISQPGPGITVKTRHYESKIES